MKTKFQTVVKDNIATGAVLAATFIALIGAVVDSTDAFAEHPLAQLPMQHMETIAVTASRANVIALDTIVVTASRETK